MNDFYAAVLSDGQLSLCSRETDEVLEDLAIVQAAEAHRNYICATWVRSYEAQARKLRIVSGDRELRLLPDSYRLGESQVAERFWPQARVVQGSDGYTVHAWVCGVSGRLFHVYVPPHLRGRGVAKALVEQYCGKQYVVYKPWPTAPRSHLITYNPYIIVPDGCSGPLGLPQEGS